MAQLVAILACGDDDYRRDLGRLVRSASVPVGIVDEHRGPEQAPPDLAFVDLRADVAGGVAAVERLRAAHPTVSIFAIAQTTDPEVILQSMRAGANEFFSWPVADEAFHAAIRRAAARRESSQGTTRQPSQTLVFFGAKGGAGTTTIAVNSGVKIARESKRPTLALDLKPCFGEVALFLGMRPRFTVLDAIDNMHRLDRDFLRELVARHKSDLEVLAGSEQPDRPSASDAGGIEELFRVLGRVYDFVVVDAGNTINSCTIGALYAADALFVVVTPDVPSVRNAQRLIDRTRQLGVSGERVRVLLNRAGTPGVAPNQIEAALGYPVSHTFPSDYIGVSMSINAGVPIVTSTNSEMASQLDGFARQLLSLGQQPDDATASEQKKPALTFSFFSW
jgi:pilus assembly protein CpaE